MDKQVSLRDIKARQWISLTVGILACIASGNQYAFGAVAQDFKAQRGYTQSEIEFVASLGNVGLYLGPVSGICYDMLGRRKSCLMSAVFNFTGFLLMFLTFNSTLTTTTSANFQGFFLFICGTGSGLLLTSSFLSNSHAFPDKWVVTVNGILIGSAAIGATIISTIYTKLFQPDLRTYFLFLTILNSSAGIIASIFLLPNPHKEPKQYNEALGIRAPESATEVFLSDEQRGSEKRASELRVSVANTDTEFGGKDTYIGEQRSLRRVADVFLQRMVDPIFWLLFVIFTISTGAGVLQIINVGNVIKALNGNKIDPDATNIGITIINLSSAFGRITMGISDYVRIRRGVFITVFLLLMSVGHLLNALILIPGSENFGRVYGTSAVIGYCYGSTFVIVVSIVSEIWDVRDYGQNIGYILLAVAAGSYMFNGVAGSFYGHQIDIHSMEGIPLPTDMAGNDSPNDCIGEDCYRSTYIFAAAACLFGALLSLFLVPHTRKGKLSENDAEVGEKSIKRESYIALAKSSNL